MGRKGGKSKRGGASAKTAESDVHILGKHNAAKLSQMMANALRVLKDPCVMCNYVPKEKEKFHWAAVVTMDECGNILKDSLYVVEYEMLRYKKQGVVHDAGQALGKVILKF